MKLLRITHITFAAALLFMAACRPSVPETYTDSKQLPKIYPDYVDVTIPVNIAPLTFLLDEDCPLQGRSAGDCL